MISIRVVVDVCWGFIISLDFSAVERRMAVDDKMEGEGEEDEGVDKAPIQDCSLVLVLILL